MKISELADSVTVFYEKILRQKCRILSILPGENEWTVICEVNIDPDYTTRRGIGDIVEIYETHINDKMEVTGFSLKTTKKKASVDNE